MLITDVGDEVCWWQLVGDGLVEMSSRSNFCHQHPKSIISLKSPTSRYPQHHCHHLNNISIASNGERIFVFPLAEEELFIDYILSFARVFEQNVIVRWTNHVFKLIWLFDKPFKVNVLTEAVSPNVIHDKCDATIFGPSFECELTEDKTEPKMQCIEDCGITKYICDCNVYRYFFLFYPGLGRTVLVLGRPPFELQVFR